MQATDGFPSVTLGNWRTDPWHQPWCTLHVWISCPSNSTNEFGRNLGDAQIGDMEVSTLPILFTSKKSAFPLELPRGRSPLCPWPRSGLFLQMPYFHSACAYIDIFILQPSIGLICKNSPERFDSFAMCSFCRLQLWNVDGGPNDALCPKKGNPAILGHWQEKIQASGLGQTKICPWWNVQ